MMYRLFLLFSALAFSDWIDERVEKELAPFPEKSIERSKIAAAAKGAEGLNLYAEAAHIVIEGGQVRVASLLTTGDWIVAYYLRRFIRDVNAWQKIARVCPSRKLPDTEFILSFSDGIESKRQSAFVNVEKYGVPVFTFSKRKGSQRLVLFPDSRSFSPRFKERRAVAIGVKKFPWKAKSDALFWQGAGNDGLYTKGVWRSNPRARLVCLAREKPGLIDANFTGELQYCDRKTLDEVFQAVGPMVPAKSPADYLKHKYLLDLEGASLDWVDTFAALASNSALFKQEGDFIQWYSDQLEPFVHYIPVKGDLSDLEEQIAWAKEHDPKVCEIARAGSRQAEKLFDRTVSFDYFQRLLLAYNRRLVP